MILLFNFSWGNLEIWVKYTYVASVISKMVVVIAIPFFYGLWFFLGYFEVQIHSLFKAIITWIVTNKPMMPGFFFVHPEELLVHPTILLKWQKCPFNKKFKKHSPLASLFITLLLLFIIFVEVLELCHRPVNPDRQSLCRCHTVSDNFVVISTISGLAPYPSICLIFFCGLENSCNIYELSIYMSYTNC